MPTKTPDFPPPPTRSRLVATPWAVLTLAFLGAAAGLGYDLYAEQRSIVENERHRLAHQSEVVQVSLSRQIQVTSNALDTMRSALPAMLAQQDGSRLANRYLQTMAPGMTGVRKLVLVAPGGKVIAGSQPELTGRDYRDSERYRTMRDRGDPNLLYISEPFTTLAGTVTIALGKIVLDDRGRVAAYLIAGMDPEYFITMLKSMLYASDMRVLLIHGDGKAILRLPEPAGIPGMDFATMPESFTARHLDSGLDSSLMSGMAASTGEHLLAALRTVRPESIRSDKTLIVLLGRRTDAMFERWRQDLALHVSLFALVALSSFLGLWLYQRRQFALEQTLAAEEAARARAEKSLRTQEAEHSRTEEKLRNSEARFHRLFEDMRQAVVLLEDGRCIAANRAALAMLRVDQADKLVGKTPMDISPPFQPDGRASAEKAAEMIWIASELGSNVFEWEHVRANGEPFMTRVLVSLIRQSDKDLHHVVLYDITQEQLARQELELLAFHDTLTGLPNRLLGREQLRRAIAAAARDNSRLAVLHISLCQLKAVNDAYGETTGDHLLVSVAMRLHGLLRDEDLLCRRSGDGFMLVFTRMLSYQQLSELCDAILARCAAPFGIAGLQLGAPLALGAAFYPKDGTDGDTLERNADTALRQARKAGPGSCFFFEPGMNTALERYVQLRDALRLAIERGEFELHYQPQLDLRSGRLVGAAACLHWRRHGQPVPLSSEVIKVAEESGLAIPLGRWAVHSACRQAAAWNAPGREERLVVSLALCSAQYRGAQAQREVEAALADSGLDPACLELVLTESLLQQHDEAALAMLGRWAARGIRLCLDDFGSGYSNLAYIRRLRVHKLRLDLSGFADLEADAEQRAIVQAMLEGAQHLGLETAAKGVGDQAMADRLREMGCGQALGHLLPAREFERWLADRLAESSEPVTTQAS